jgi:hypothetical protein
MHLAKHGGCIILMVLSIGLVLSVFICKAVPQDSSAQVAVAVTDTTIFYGQLSDSFYTPLFYYKQLETLRLAHLAARPDFFEISRPLAKDIYVRPAQIQNWFFYFFLLMCLLILFVKVFFNKFFVDNWQSIFKRNAASSAFRQHDFVYSLPGLLLNFNFFIISSTLFYLYIADMKLVLQLHKAYLIMGIFFVIGLGYFLFRSFIYVSIGKLFAFKGLAESSLFYDRLFINFLGIVFLPALIIIPYSIPLLSKLTWWGILIIICIMIVYRLVIAWQMSNKFLISNFMHFMLYICAVEIAPILIVVRFIKNYMGLA